MQTGILQLKFLNKRIILRNVFIRRSWAAAGIKALLEN